MRTTSQSKTQSNPNQRSIIVLTTRLGGIDSVANNEPQSVKHDFYEYDAPLRDKAMTPRLQAKIPKMFGWQLKPDYEFYLWLDGNLRLSHKDSLKFLLDELGDNDVLVLNHKDRNTIYWEYRYNLRGLTDNAPSNYLRKRYSGEWLDEQFNEINNYADSPLYQGGVFLYRSTPKVHQALKEWWYYVSRYLIMDQLAFPYVLRGLKVKALDKDFTNCWFLENSRHAK